MDTNELNAPTRAPSRVRRPATRSGARVARGVTHRNTRHRNRFTVVGNHFAQHTELSFLARGLGLYIQSLPDGVIIAIKFLSARFPESEARIAAALRELEAAGYLSRDRVRLPNGQVVTRTVFRNQPDATPAPTPAQAPVPAPADPAEVREHRPARAPVVAPPHPVDVPQRETTPAPDELPPLWAGFEDAPSPQPQQQPSAPATPERPARPTHPTRPTRPKLSPPTPRTFDPERDQAARDLLVSLRVDDPRLTLADRDVHRLGPAVASWLERSVAPEAVRQELLKGLPDRPGSPRALIEHRLTVNMPGALPPAPVVLRPDPMQDCDGCGRVFRAPGPGRCRDCRTEDVRER
ncbi:helix-turn-helix domain-containing protein [Streptomyces sp. NPDC091272]|uniref:helix-turn-helix domain-containing protein n=1 Tax=Streptomyces sp. NPDC091272 TaxID=3365981 RepID=UPI0038195680